MPFACALAVCTTFCHHVAPALIPIFGPSFPSKCVPPEAPEHGRMVIDPRITQTATTEAERLRIKYSSHVMSRTAVSVPAARRYQPSLSESPRERVPARLKDRHSPHMGRGLRLKRPYAGLSSPYGTDTDADTGSETGSERYTSSPTTPSSGVIFHRLWKGGNTSMPVPLDSRGKGGERILGHREVHLRVASEETASPWLSAVPRSSPGAIVWGAKRRVQVLDEDYDGEESGSGSEGVEARVEEQETGVVVEDKKAALLLMHLSVRDKEHEIATRLEGPRVKRRRAVSM
jgi:hypothetical protein